MNLKLGTRHVNNNVPHVFTTDTKKTRIRKEKKIKFERKKKTFKLVPQKPESFYDQTPNSSFILRKFEKAYDF